MALAVNEFSSQEREKIENASVCTKAKSRIKLSVR